MNDNLAPDAFSDSAYLLADGIFKSIISSPSYEVCQMLGKAVNELSDILETIHPDLTLELGHLVGFMQEKLGGPSYTNPKSAVEGQIELGITTIQDILRN